MNAKQRSISLIGLLISALFLWIALRNTNLSDIGLAFRSAKLVFALPLLAALFGFYWLRAVRWRQLLAPWIEVAAARLFPPLIIGYGVNVIFPLQLGELARSYVTAERLKVKMAPVVTSVVLERIFDFMIIIAILAVALMLEKDLPQLFWHTGIVLLAGVAVLSFLSILYVTKTSQFISTVETTLSKLPDVVREKVVTQLRHGTEGMAAVKQPKLLLSVLLLSVVHWGFIGICIQCSLWAFDIQADIVTVSLLLGLVLLSTSIPTSPGNLGAIQLAYTLGLQTNGASASVIVAASVFYHILTYVSVLVVAFLFVSQFGYSWRRLKQDISSKNP